MDDSFEEPETKPKNIKKIRGIATDLIEYHFPESVKALASEIFFRLDVGNPRKLRRKKIIFYCIYQARLELEMEDIDPITLGKDFGFTKSETLSAINMKPKFKDGYTPCSTTMDLSGMLRLYASKSFRFTDEVTDEIVKEFEDLINKNESLVTKQARTLIAAFLWYYMSSNGYVTKREEFAKIFHLKISTIELHQKDIVDTVVND